MRPGWPSACPDHPRSRGVYRDAAPVAAALVGSSPLARGLPMLLPWNIEKVGIIPARAGFTPRSAGESPSDRDHPRSRGVYRICPTPNGQSPGSSPLARGLPGRPLGPVVAPRIIPARAGFTSVLWSLAMGAWDHPRSRGVYGTPNSGSLWMDGSSPLARGLPGRVHPAGGQCRIIPARAGFT